jgi:hypothetical protein
MDAPASARLLIVCDWIPPALNAVGQYMAQRAAADAASGRDVTLIGLGEGKNREETQRLGEGALRTIRLGVAPTPKESLLRRLFWTLQANARLIARTGRIQRGSPCEIVVTGSPPFLSYVMIVLNRLVWRRRLTYRIMDFYPEVIFAAGKARALRFVTPVFRALRRGADRIEALGEDQKRRLVEGGVRADRVFVERLGAPIGTAPETRPAPRPTTAGEALLLYSGNLGVAHDITTFCEAYRRHIQDGSNRVRLWVNGAGAQLEPLQAYCARHGLPLHVTSGVPLSELPGLMKAPDAHLVLLGEAFWGYVHPSKIYACLEAGQPILYFGPREADIATLIKAHARSRQIDPGDVGAGFAALETLAASVAPGDAAAPSAH